MPLTPLTLLGLKEEYLESVAILQWKHRFPLGHKAETYHIDYHGPGLYNF